MRRRDLLVAAGAAALSGLPSAAFGAGFPSRTMRFVVPFPPGGSADLAARIVADGLAKRFGKPVIVDNRPGAAGIIATTYTYNAPPDGYVIMLGNNQIYNNPLLYKSVPYDPTRLTPVAPIFTNPLVLVASPSLPATTTQELVAYARAHPGNVNYAVLGPGSSSHLLSLEMEHQFGISMSMVSYKGSADAEQALLSGDVQIYFDAPATALPFIQAGKTKALAVVADQRIGVLPSTPTTAEGGVNVTAAIWHGVVAPPGLDPALVETIGSAIHDIVATPAVQDRLTSVGLVPQLLPSAKAFGQFVELQAEKWSAIIRPLGLHLD